MENEPNSATDQQAGEFAIGVMSPHHPKICGQARCEHENWRTKMGDPAGKENSRRRTREVSRQELLGTEGDVVANVIDRRASTD